MPPKTIAKPAKANRKSAASIGAASEAAPAPVPRQQAPLKVERMALEKLRPDPKNARTHGKRNLAAIKASLTRFGQRKPVVVDKAGVVLAGNGTLEAAQALGWTHLDVVHTNLKGKEARAYALADNRSGDLSDWDDDALSAALRELQAGEVSLADLGWNDRELAALLKGDTATTAAEEAAQRHRLGPRHPIFLKRGELWALGEHRLFVGDSFTPSTMTRLLAGLPRPSLLLTDPPYAVFGSSTGIGSDIADDEMIRPFFEAVLQLAVTYLPDFAHVYLFCDWKSWAAIWEAAKRKAISVKNMIVWDKGDGGLGSNYTNCHEEVFFGAKLPPARAMKSSDRGGQRIVLGKSNILRHPRVTGDDRRHNAAKPVELLIDLLDSSTDKGEYVLEPFSGGGSTLLACEQTGRRCLAVDKEPKWAQTTMERWEEATGLKASRLEQAKDALAAEPLPADPTVPPSIAEV